ncbi:MAG: phenylalanine--tRNA ligase subunit beta [Candidatus Moranbacteria bacterium]|nr:phenylalanine--tRNA ligase subunit beta [Candidatus Moranbacteria bacterium]
MKYSYNWLKELSKTKLAPKKLADLVTRRAFELEETEPMSRGLENVVVGRIEKVEKHPNADRLQLAKVNIGSKILDIVCGAPNIAPGQKVPAALDGACLLSGIQIKEAEIRGAKSQGMLCSEKDLGIGEDHAGIMILESDAKVGENLAKYLGFDDVQLQFDILPNRAHDALSHIGMAREICAIEGRKIKFPSIPLHKRGKIVGNLSIEISDKKICPRYIGVKMEGIEVMPSPTWIEARLKTCGIRPINNIVDITNYVMLETGQPLHSFDASAISDQKSRINIQVRKAKKNEKIKLLDEKEYVLNENDIVIASPEKALALAGVMGGENSGISDETTSIVLESANFNPTMIRKTRARPGLNSESSYRFEREVDPNLAEVGAARAIELIEKYGGKNVKVSAYKDVYPAKVKPWKIKLDPDYAKSLLGENIPEKKIKNILENLGMKVLGNLVSKREVEIPTGRIDLKTQEDLIEEIGRIYGYENIPAQAPRTELTAPTPNEKRIFENKLKDLLVGLGFSEMLNYSFYSASDIEKCGLGIAGHYEVANPMNPDQQYLRRSMIPGLLKNININQKHFDEIKIFEIGRKYRDIGKINPDEYTVFSGAYANSRINSPFFELKGSFEALCRSFRIKAEYKRHKRKYSVWHPGRVAEIWIKDIKIGKIGEINPLTAKQYGINSRVALFGVSVDNLFNAFLAKERQFRSISKFPSVKRDISMFVGGDIVYADIEKEVEKSGGELVLGVELFDLFEKDGEKSLAVRAEIGSNEKTLTSEEIDAVMGKIISNLEKNLKVKVRK